MAVSLDELIVENRESLVDGIVKDAIGQIPAYARAPLRRTIARVEQALQAMADSIRQNDPDILEQHLGESRRNGVRKATRFWNCTPWCTS